MPPTPPAHRRPRPRSPPQPWSTSAWFTLPLLVALLAAPSGGHALRSDAVGLERRASTVPGVLFAGDYVCRLEGECAPCPASELSTTVCKLFGNRRSLSCIPRRNGKPVESARVPSASSAGSSSHLSSSGGGAAGAGEAGRKAGGESGSEEGADSHPDSAPPDPGHRPVAAGGGGRLRVEEEAGAKEAEEEAEEGRLAGDTQAEEELQLAMEEVQAELDSSAERMRHAGAASAEEEEDDDELRAALSGDRRRRRSGTGEIRVLVDEEQYERLVKRQGGVQLKTQAWEACPRVLKQEREDFFEYILCNLLFALLSLSVLVWRQRQLALHQFGRLAARIMQTEVHTT